MFKQMITFAAVAVLVFALAPAAQAAPLTGPGGIIAPTGLGLGDTYHLVFATSSTRNATSAVIGDYNTFVNDVADLSSLTGVPGVTWYAIGSTPTVDAKNNAVVSAAVYLLDGSTKVVDDFTDMWDGDLDNGINLDEDASSVGGFAWTGSNTGGTGQGNETLGGAGGKARIGEVGSNGGWWIMHFNVPSQGDGNHLYALSAPLTVIPEPATLVLLGLGGLGVIIRRRRS